MVLLAGSLTLAVADPLFIFVFNLGVIGAGLSYGLSALVALGVGLALLQRHIGLSARLNLKLLRLHAFRVSRIAVPAMLANLAMPVGITYLMITLARQGASALAGMAVVDRVLQLAYCAFFALPTALVPILAQNLGAGRTDRARQAIAFTGKLVVLYGVALWLALLVAGPGIADYFQLTDTGRGMFLAFSHFGAGLWIIFGLDFVAQSLFLTLGRAWWVPTFGWLRGTLGSIPFVYVGAHGYGGTGALVGMWSGNALVALLAIATAMGVARQYGRQRP
jgi:Na+-driven multidrug efflux pump